MPPVVYSPSRVHAARRCAIRSVRISSSGMGLLDLVKMHSWHVAARNATNDAYSADFATPIDSKLLFQCDLQGERRCHADLPIVARGVARSPTNVPHGLLEDDGAVFLVRDCMRDGLLRLDSWPSRAQIISALLAFWHGSSCMLLRRTP